MNAPVLTAADKGDEFYFPLPWADHLFRGFLEALHEDFVLFLCSRFSPFSIVAGFFDRKFFAYAAPDLVRPDRLPGRSARRD